MPNTIHLRTDQNQETVEQIRANVAAVTLPGQPAKTPIILAPRWVKDMLHRVSPYLWGQTFDIYDSTGKNKLSTFTLKPGKTITLQELQMVTRHQAKNCSGIINTDFYSDIPKDYRFQLAITLRDLVKQCVIVGTTEVRQYGGYPTSSPITPIEPEIMIMGDLSGVQFQHPNNVARLFFIPKDPSVLPQGLRDQAGLLDGEIYKSIVGEPKKTFKQATKANDPSRYSYQENGPWGEGYYDFQAQRLSNAQDFYLYLKGLDIIATEENLTNVCASYVKYATGFFLGYYQTPEFMAEMEKAIVDGVSIGLNAYRRDLEAANRATHITSIELPYYRQDGGFAAPVTALRTACQRHQTELFVEPVDFLKPRQGSVKGFTDAADPHAGPGNEMYHGSVDAAAGENQTSKGNQFNPAVYGAAGIKMREQYVAFNVLVRAHRFCDDAAPSLSSAPFFAAASSTSTSSNSASIAGRPNAELEARLRNLGLVDIVNQFIQAQIEKLETTVIQKKMEKKQKEAGFHFTSLTSLKKITIGASKDQDTWQREIDCATGLKTLLESLRCSQNYANGELRMSWVTRTIVPGQEPREDRFEFGPDEFVLRLKQHMESFSANNADDMESGSKRPFKKGSKLQTFVHEFHAELAELGLRPDAAILALAAQFQLQ